jgi:hypothetical protein
MRGAGSAPRDASTKLGLALIACVVFTCGFAASAVAASPTSATIDFSQAGIGPFDQSFFSEADFTQGSFVGYVQGDEALIGPIAGTAASKFTSVSADISPAFQGTADYTIEALSPADRVIGSSTVRVTQDTEDPETGPWGYVTLGLNSLPKKASSFRIRNSFVRSSFPNITVIDFGVASITLSR